MKMRLVHIFALLAMVLCGCYDSHKEPPRGEDTRTDNCDISALKLLAKDGCYNITTDLICECRITSSDSEGNFYRSIVVEDRSGGAEVKLGIYNSASHYPVGLVVALHLNGLAVMFDNGVAQIGLPPQSYDLLPRELETQVLLDKHILRSNTIEEVAPRTCDIASLDSSQCGELVAFSKLRHSPLEGEEDDLIEGYSRFTDKEGNAIFLYVSAYANFATNEVPAEEVTIQGVLYHEPVGMDLGRQFVIKPRFANDITIGDNTH